MQRLTIDRGPSSDVGTFGTAALGTTTWHSLELPWRDNEPNLSCIPVGVYPAKYLFSEKFGREVYHLQDVPGRSNVELHGANWAGDTTKGWHSDLEGCCSIGESEGTLTPELPGARPQRAIERSWAAIDALVAMTAGQDIEIEIRWSPGNDPGSFDPSVVA